MVPGESRQRRRIPRPLLEHLRRRLHEILLGADAAHADPSVPARDERVDQMAELVKEGNDIVVRHQARIAGLAAWQIAYQRGFRNLTICDAGADRKCGGMVVFVRPRMHVEVEPPDRLAVLDDLVRFDRFVPHGRILHRPVGEAEQPAGDVEHPLFHTIEREVGAHRLRIEVVARFPYELRVVRAFPRVDHRGTG